MSETKEAAELPGEVWRKFVDIRTEIAKCCVVLCDGEWFVYIIRGKRLDRPKTGSLAERRILAAWAMHEYMDKKKAEAERDEARVSLAEAFRMAEEDHARRDMLAAIPG